VRLPAGRGSQPALRTGAEWAALKPKGTLALVGGDEWTDPCDALDQLLLERSKRREVVVLPTAAAFENPEKVLARAVAWFGSRDAEVRGLAVLNRRDAENDANVAAVRDAPFLYIADGSPLHLRSVLMGSALYGAIVQAHSAGAVLAASGASATVLCDPMVDPRGGAYTVGLGIVQGLAVFPYHGTAAEHIRERSIDLLPANAVLAGIDEHTALVRDDDGKWSVVGAGRVVLYRKGAKAKTHKPGAELDLAEVATTR
jgi:cyanophycinase